MKSLPRPKRSEQGQPPSPFRFRGLWRDEKLLVVDLAEHHFPRRCLKSNQVVEALEKITLTYGRPTTAELQLLRGSRFKEVQITIVEASRQRTRVLLELPLPLSPWWRAVWLSPWGKRSIVSGLAVLLAVYVLYGIGGVGNPEHKILAGLFRGTAILALLCGVAFQIALRWVLPVYRVCEGKMWIGGVHRDWLQRLPKFAPSRTMLAEEIWLLNASLWTCFWFGVFVLGLFLGGRFSGELSSKEDSYVGYALLTVAAAAILVGNRARMLLHTAKQKLAAMDPPVRRKRRR